ncbi:DUF2845 domain-containing protein [Geomonas sp. RF6]|uniref:DUF2845 domain-containing protein n=1 Tax=Geomonas sp. RF6 TaxID=2897342 RepID=UPI001E2C3C47|nr:DUF2845 domain-containing protein [Geomonas sp. RF6]UFS71173.1 DUF2845 domain-containing protein [Geomonas sp. RF6]
MKKLPIITLFIILSSMSAYGGVNEFDSCRCGNAIATKGDSKQEVLQKCGQPAKVSYQGTSCYQMWLYNFGPNEFMQGICFDSGDKVKKVLSLNHGY